MTVMVCVLAALTASLAVSFGAGMLSGAMSDLVAQCMRGNR
jgi:hypothetical protein